MKHPSILRFLAMVMVVFYCGALAQAGQLITDKDKLWARQAIQDEIAHALEGAGARILGRLGKLLGFLHPLHGRNGSYLFDPDNHHVIAIADKRSRDVVT